jgi:hypothetical protein
MKFAHGVLRNISFHYNHPRRNLEECHMIIAS